MANLAKEIAKLICLAQIASDSGKGIHSLILKDDKFLSKKAANAGYNIKDDFILSAINLIRSNPKVGWSYKMVEGKDKNNNNCRIIYFNFTKSKTYFQISFHAFSKRKYENIINTGVLSIEWNNKSKARIAAYCAYKFLGGKAYLKK